MRLRKIEEMRRERELGSGRKEARGQKRQKGEEIKMCVWAKLSRKEVAEETKAGWLPLP